MWAFIGRVSLNLKFYEETSCLAQTSHVERSVVKTQSIGSPPIVKPSALELQSSMRGKVARAISTSAKACAERLIIVINITIYSPTSLVIFKIIKWFEGKTSLNWIWISFIFSYLQALACWPESTIFWMNAVKMRQEKEQGSDWGWHRPSMGFGANHEIMKQVLFTLFLHTYWNSLKNRL